MLRRFPLLGVGVLALAFLLGPPSAAHAQHGRGGGSHAPVADQSLGYLTCLWPTAPAGS